MKSKQSVAEDKHLGAPVHDRRGVVFIEANPFASRLHVLGPMAKGAAGAGQEVSIIAPERSRDTDFSEFENVLPEGLTYLSVRSEITGTRPKISPQLMMRLLMGARRQLQGFDKRTLVFTALDDYFSMIPWLSVMIRLLFPKTRVIVIRYRVADLLNGPRKQGVQRLKAIFVRLLDVVVDPETAIFDERVASDSGKHVLPDPWSGPFGKISRADARERLHWDADGDVVLLVGGQDERKGFDVAAAALQHLCLHRANLRVTLVGRVSPSMQSHLRDLTEGLKDRFVHIPQYLSDEDLSVFFAASSVILLPYHTAFTSTSGVLVRAAASSTPVVASGHGLVGWRTRHHSLGVTFAYPDHAGLSDSIADVLDTSFDSSSAHRFAAACTEDKLALSFQKLLHVR